MYLSGVPERIIEVYKKTEWLHCTYRKLDVIRRQTQDLSFEVSRTSYSNPNPQVPECATLDFSHTFGTSPTL
jgi:hypothetical protein